MGIIFFIGKFFFHRRDRHPRTISITSAWTPFTLLGSSNCAICFSFLMLSSSSLRAFSLMVELSFFRPWISWKKALKCIKYGTMFILPIRTTTVSLIPSVPWWLQNHQSLNPEVPGSIPGLDIKKVWFLWNTNWLNESYINV